MKIVDTFHHEEITGYKFGYLPIGKPTMLSHIYYVDGLLIDTGHSKMRQEIIATVKDLDVNQIFITHHHEDHSGNIAAFKKIFDCKIYASDLCSKIMEQPPPLSLAQKFLWGNRHAFKGLLPKSHTIETKNYTFEIIPIPGHAGDMVALYERNKKWLFSADLFINHYIGYFVHNEDIALQISSIKAIQKLDYDTLLCSHNPQLINGKEALAKKLDFLEEFYKKVSLLYLNGLSKTEIFKKLNLKEYHFMKLISGGQLSKMNMINSVIKNVESNHKI